MPSPMIYQDLTTAALLGHAAQYHSETEIVSVSTGGEKERSCWGEVASRAQRLASALASLGLPPGARCATLAWNNRRHLEIYFAVASGGWVTHTVNPRLSVDHLRYILNDAADEVLFFDQTFLPLVAQLLPQLPTVKHVVLMESRSEAALSQLPSLLFYDDLLQQGMADYRWPQLNELTPASLCYTSGTTGRPKGVLNTHRSLVLHALSGNQPDAAGISAKDSLLPVVPMFHVNAWGTPFIAAMVGALLLLLLCRERVMFAQRCVDGADGRCFGHSPGVGQRNAVITLKGLGHRRRQRGAADQRTFKFRQPDLCPAHRRQQAGPDHRYAKPHRHLLGGQQLQQAVAIEVRPRQHQPRADHGGDKRRPPRVDMEHRHHQHTVEQT